MTDRINSISDRFDKALYVMMQNLGPHLFTRIQIGLTPGQIFMLYFIQQTEHCSVSKLAEKMEVNPSAITVMLDRLENHGFVIRSRDTQDRRVVNIHVTDAGKEALNEVMKVRKKTIEYCLNQLAQEELDSFVNVLEKLATISNTADVTSIVDINKYKEES